MAFRVDPARDGQVLEYAVEATPGLLTLKPSGGGEIDFVIAGQGTLRVRGRGVSLRLEMPPERWTWAYRLPGAWAFNFSPYQVQLALDVMQGDATLFIRRDEIDNQWRLITPILEAWANQAPPDFPNYAAGSEGPAEADELIARNGHRWSPISGGLSGCEK